MGMTRRAFWKTLSAGAVALLWPVREAAASVRRPKPVESPQGATETVRLIGGPADGTTATVWWQVYNDELWLPLHMPVEYRVVFGCDYAALPFDPTLPEWCRVRYVRVPTHCACCARSEQFIYSPE
jgi:hypothetical protein